jgi:cytidylate kinase
MFLGRRSHVIGIVGPCGAGKSTLAGNLARLGITGRHIAQEHSYVPDMWFRITHPDKLIFLDASYAITVERRKLTWTIEEYNEQVYRLRHARLHADLYLLTDQMTIQEVLQATLNFLQLSQ